MILLLMVPPTIILMSFSYEPLAWWIDPAFAEASASVLRWLTVGTLFTSLASVAVGTLAGINRPALTAIPPLIQLPFFIFGVWWVLQAGYGIAAVAVVIVARILIDGIVLCYLMTRTLPFERVQLRRAGLLLCFTALGLLVVSQPLGATERLGLCLTTSVLHAGGLWRFGLDSGEHSWLRSLLARRTQ